MMLLSIPCLGMLLLLPAQAAMANADLMVRVGSCDDPDGFSPGTILSLYSSDGLVAERYYDWLPEKFENLPSGNYQLAYLSLYQQSETLTVDLEDGKITEVSICVDTVPSSLSDCPTFIDALQVGEQYIISVESLGCFHQMTTDCSIFREATGYLLTYNDKTRLLTEEEVGIIRTVERQLNYAPSYNCTTVDTFMVTYNDQVSIFDDASCQLQSLSSLSGVLKPQHD